MNEEQLTEELVREMSPYFEIEREVNGVNVFTGISVRADIVAKARREVTLQGFTSEPFVVEVKAIPKNDQPQKANATAWQTVTYRFSEFGGRRVAFALMYPQFVEFFKAKYPGDDNYAFGGRCVQVFLMKANVGWIKIEPEKAYRPKELVIGFGGDRYWSSSRGVSKVENLGLSVRVGNTESAPLHKRFASGS